MNLCLIHLILLSTLYQRIRVMYKVQGDQERDFGMKALIYNHYLMTLNSTVILSWRPTVFMMDRLVLAPNRVQTLLRDVVVRDYPSNVD